MCQSARKARETFGALRESALFVAQHTILYFYFKGIFFLRELIFADLFGNITEINLRGRGISEDFSEIILRLC